MNTPTIRDALTPPRPNHSPCAASVQFLVDAFGFEVTTEQRKADGGVIHAELRRGDAVIMGGDGSHRPAATPGLYLVVDDVDDKFKRAVAAGAAEVYPPETTEWGTQRARLHDLDGHEWSLGTYQPGQPWPADPSGNDGR